MTEHSPENDAPSAEIRDMPRLPDDPAERAVFKVLLFAQDLDTDNGLRDAAKRIVRDLGDVIPPAKGDR